MNLADLFTYVSILYKARTAIVENGKEVTFQELRERIDRLTIHFRLRGLGDGHRVALILPNGSDFICCFFSLLKIHAIAAPISPDCTSFELKRIFNNLNPHAIITLSPIILKHGKESPELFQNKLLIARDSFAEELDQGSSGERLFTVKKCDSANDNCCRRNDIATINYTYRGWGYPLGAQLSHDNYLQAAMFYIQRTGLTDQHRVLLVLPSYHVFALMGGIVAPLFAGATVVIAKSFIISHIFNMIRQYRITMLLAVPTLYRLMITYARDASVMHSVQFCITGGDIMSSEVHAELSAKFNTEVLQGYGLTECLPVTCNPSNKNKVGSLGPSGRSDVVIQIVNNSGDKVSPGVIGEITVSGPSVMHGYYRMDEITRAVLKDGWLYTGDYGYIDKDGYLYFSSRKKKIVKVGGKLVDLQEVKDVLQSHPGIQEVTLLLQEDQLWGHTIEAEILPREKREVSERDVRLYCAQRLSSYKIPKVIRCPESVEVSKT